MSLFITMLPVYVLGNLHCLGMCGPLVMLLGRHRYRYWYFLGRILSFSLAAMCAAAVGGALQALLIRYQIPAMTSFLFGGVILLMGFFTLFRLPMPGLSWLARRLSGTEGRLSLLLLRDTRLATFLFGFFTVALPCGQSLLVFSACALAADPIVGAANGFAFALLTSPSLLLALRAQHLLKAAKAYYNQVMGILAIVVGLLAIARGLAEIQVINHFVLNPEAPHYLRLVIF